MFHNIKNFNTNNLKNRGYLKKKKTDEIRLRIFTTPPDSYLRSYERLQKIHIISYKLLKFCWGFYSFS